jgi:RsiW-degrading membrane proteinase PrsW (M82 family)
LGNRTETGVQPAAIFLVWHVDCAQEAMIAYPSGAAPAPADPPPTDPEPTGSPLRRILLIVGAMVLLLVLFAANTLLILSSASSWLAVGLSAVAAFVPAVIFTLLVVMLDRYEREPRQILAAAFLWGALVATLISVVANGTLRAFFLGLFGREIATVLSPVLSAPLVEELSKGLALVLLFFFLRHEFDNVLDGIVYGSLVGIGFAMTENLLYFVRTYSEAESEGEAGLASLAVLFYLRVVVGGLAHAVYTATTGAGLGYAGETSSRLLKVLAPLVALILAICQHATWNLLSTSLPPLLQSLQVGGAAYLLLVAPSMGFLLIGPGVLVLFVLVVMTWKREAAAIREQLQDEVATGTITPDEYARLASTRRRLAAELGALFRHGPGAWRATGQLHHLATELAFRKWHLSRGEKPKREQKDLREDQFRRRIRLLRVRLPASAELVPSPAGRRTG